MNNIKAIYYWSIQIIVWTLLSGVIAIGYWYGGNLLKLQLWQIVLDFSVIAVLSILFTHLLKFLLNKFIEFDNLKVIDGFKILGLLIVVNTVFFIIYLLYVRIAYTFVYNRVDVFNHVSQSFKNHVIFYINYTIYFIVWAVFYVAIKGLMELNKGRETRLALESNLKESQLNTLKGQINPHFMFNSLNNIRGLIIEDPLKSRDMITKLSEILRYSLSNNENNLINIEDELEIVENYIAISKIQLEDRLTYNQIIDKELLKVSIPPMLIQILVENAVKHGVSNLKNGGVIELKIFKEVMLLNIIVTNTGRLNESKESTKIGIKNIQKRLKLLYESDSSFKLFENENNVVAHIKLPML